MELLRGRYRERGLGGTAGVGRAPALVVVDLIRGFTDPRLPLGSESGSVVAATGRLVAAARGHGFPVFFTTCVHASSSAAWARKIPAHRTLLMGSPSVELDPRLDRRADEPMIVKHCASAFFGTDLAELLREIKVDTVILAGVTTSGCVRASAVDAVSHGFGVVVAREAVGDRAELPHEMSLFDIDAKYGDVLSVAGVLEEFDRVVGVSRDGLS